MDYDNPIKNDFLYGVYKLHIECKDYDLDGTFIAIKGLTEELLKSIYIYLNMKMVNIYGKVFLNQSILV